MFSNHFSSLNFLLVCRATHTNLRTITFMDQHLCVRSVCFIRSFILFCFNVTFSCVEMLFCFSVVQLTFPRLNGRLFCVHRISVSGMDPSTSQLMLYSISDAKCFGFDVMLIEVGFTVYKQTKRIELNDIPRKNHKQKKKQKNIQTMKCGLMIKFLYNTTYIHNRKKNGQHNSFYRATKWICRSFPFYSPSMQWVRVFHVICIVTEFGTWRVFACVQILIFPFNILKCSSAFAPECSLSFFSFVHWIRSISFVIQFMFLVFSILTFSSHPLLSGLWSLVSGYSLQTSIYILIFSFCQSFFISLPSLLRQSHSKWKTCN